MPIIVGNSTTEGSSTLFSCENRFSHKLENNVLGKNVALLRATGKADGKRRPSFSNKDFQDEKGAKIVFTSRERVLSRVVIVCNLHDNDICKSTITENQNRMEQ